MRRPLLVFLLAFAACATDTRAGVARQTGIDGGWTSAKGGTHLDVTGDVATLHFQGRRFIFKPVGRLNGYVGETDVGLRGGGIHIVLDLKAVSVQQRGHAPVEAPLAEIPVGATVQYARGRLRVLGRG